jgi:hypothetical protein
MDFMKAFDKVPHTKLLVKMKAYGLSEKICIWVQDFLSDRKQCVQVNGMKSQWHKVTNGIPQGSVLGPVLFVIYINDLPESVKSDVFLFADDTKNFRKIKDDSDASIIQSDLNELFKWSETWLLKFHPDKCNVLPVLNKNKQYLENKYIMRKYEGGTTTLENVDSEKDIGVTIDQHLNFEKHIQAQINKANQIVALTRRSFVHIDNRTFSLRPLFKALVRPHLEYMRVAYGHHIEERYRSNRKCAKKSNKNVTQDEELKL